MMKIDKFDLDENVINLAFRPIHCAISAKIIMINLVISFDKF